VGIEVTADKRVGVLGMGTMGRGIVEVFLTAGYDVRCVEVDQRVITSSTDKLLKSLQNSFEKGRIKESPEGLLQRLTTSKDLDVLKGLPFAVEAIIEDLGEKQRTLATVERILDPAAVIATNTSSLSITKLSRALKDPSRLVGMHFFNPAPRMQLVEVVRGDMTSEQALRQCVDLAKELGKVPIIVKDSPGFVVNRLLIPYLTEAGKLLDQQVASAKDIDTCMKLGAGHPMGPFELSDLIGIDVVIEIAKELHAEGVGGTDAEIPEAFKKLVEQGKLGRKTKGGFFDY